MICFIEDLLFFLGERLRERKAKREALRDLRRNHWRCKEVEQVEAVRQNRSYRRINNGYHR